MPHPLFGIAKSRAVWPCSDGPPNGPFALRVSATRHGVIGTKRVETGVGGDAAEITFSVTEMVCVLLVADGESMVTVAG